MPTANEVKKLLKASGINTKLMRVRCKLGSIHIDALSHDVNIDQIKEILKPFEDIGRCEYTGEILCGGNKFVLVQYSCDITDDEIKIAQPLIEQRLHWGKSQHHSIVYHASAMFFKTYPHYCETAAKKIISDVYYTHFNN